MTFARLLAVAVSLALVAAGSPTASAQDNQRKPKRYIATRPIAIDPQTGSPRLPTPQETQELVASLVEMTNRSSDDLQVTTHSNGTKAVNIDGRFQSVMLARPNENGTFEMRCVFTFAEAADFLGLVEDPSQQ